MMLARIKSLSIPCGACAIKNFHVWGSYQAEQLLPCASRAESPAFGNRQGQGRQQAQHGGDRWASNKCNDHAIKPILSTQ
jgi:hypothetical protein